jgi:type IV leader peptidase family protein
VTALLARVSTTRLVWALPFASIGLGALLLPPGGRLAYLLGVSVTAAFVACLIAIDDHRTGLLRNQWTAPFALAGLIQVAVASAGLPPATNVATPSLLGAVITTALYILLGLLGWVGFGDVKFAAGLALFVAIPGGWSGVYLLPLALICSALPRLIRRTAARPQRVRVAHGPALAAAATVLMSAACVGHLVNLTL